MWWKVCLEFIVVIVSIMSIQLCRSVWVVRRKRTILTVTWLFAVNGKKDRGLIFWMEGSIVCKCDLVSPRNIHVLDEKKLDGYVAYMEKSRNRTTMRQTPVSLQSLCHLAINAPTNVPQHLLDDYFLEWKKEHGRRFKKTRLILETLERHCLSNRCNVTLVRKGKGILVRWGLIHTWW